MENFFENYGLGRLFANIVSNYGYIKSDYIGVSFNLHGIVNISLYQLAAVSLVLMFYLIGRKLRLFFLKKFENQNTLALFIDIALGYIYINTTIAFFGIFSLFYARILFVYLILLVFLACYPLSNFKNSMRDFIKALRSIFLFTLRNKFVFWGIFLFILISFLRLIPPEIGEDSVGYHTDLPLLYLNSHSMIIEAKDIQHVIPVPQLGEMSYVITEALGLKDASRYIHFMFYLIIVILLCYISKKSKGLIGLYPPILFVTASVVIRHASKANVDFQALFCWIMAFYLLINEKKISNNTIILSAIFLGGALSTKLWEIVFIPVFLAYIFIMQKSKLHSIKKMFLFSFFALLVSGIWYLRSYIITGNPVFPAFTDPQTLSGNVNTGSSIFDFLKINYRIFYPSNLVVFSPVFFVGIFFSLFKISNTFGKIKRSTIFYFFVILAIEHLFINYFLPRYLLNLYIVSLIVVSFGIYEFCSKVKIGKYFISAIVAVLFVYYFTNTLLILPYGFGWSDKNKYLTRILSKDRSSYYDYDRKFDKHISNKDLVATYSISGFYYANFRHIDVVYILVKNNLSSLRSAGATKLLILGGEIDWLCDKLKVIECNSNRYKLLASYLPGSMYLYQLNEN